jgi:hypothetical protein
VITRSLCCALTASGAMAVIAAKCNRHWIFEFALFANTIIFSATILIMASCGRSNQGGVCVEPEKMDGFKMMMDRRFLADANELCRLDVGELTAGFSSGKFTPL